MSSNSKPTQAERVLAYIEKFRTCVIPHLTKSVNYGLYPP